MTQKFTNILRYKLDLSKTEVVYVISHVPKCPKYQKERDINGNYV